jgi:mannose-6-phosphate isomerase-like protein (cupin superfamily)
MTNRSLAILILSPLVLSLVPLAAQQAVAPGATAPPASGRKSPSAGGNSFDTPGDIKYQKTKDLLDRRIDLFMADWHESMPRYTHGSLVVRDILTRGDNFAPPQRGAILQRANFLAYATLAAHASTTPSRLTGQQEVFYILSGNGVVTAGGVAAEIHRDIAVFIPAELEFVMRSTSGEPVTMYIINEPTPPNFHPKDKMAVTNERERKPGSPYDSSPYTLPGAAGHWAHITRGLFGKSDGLATLSGVITVTLDPMTMGEPHTHPPGHEEIWAAIEGTSLAFLGTQLRLQRPGMAFMLRPDSNMTHSNINVGDTPVKFLWF